MKHTIDGKTYNATTQEDGTITLTPQEAPKAERKQRAGDVHGEARFFYVSGHSEGDWQMCAEGGGLMPADEAQLPFSFNVFDMAKGDYVLKQDVIDALSHEDFEGDTVLKWASQGGDGWGKFETERALRKLGIHA